MAADERPKLGWCEGAYTAKTSIIGKLQTQYEAQGFQDVHVNTLERMDRAAVKVDFTWRYSDNSWHWVTLTPLTPEAELWLLANLPPSPA